MAKLPAGQLCSWLLWFTCTGAVASGDGSLSRSGNKGGNKQRGCNRPSLASTPPPPHPPTTRTLVAVFECLTAPAGLLQAQLARDERGGVDEPVRVSVH